VNALSQTKLSTVELKTWLQTETNSVLTPVQAQAQKCLEDTRVALQNLSEASKMLMENSQKEIEKRNMKVYNRARALNKLATLFVERLKKLKPPEQVSFDSLNVFGSETQKTLTVFDIDVRNWFPRISPFFIMDRRKFLPIFEKTKQVTNTLNDFVNKEYVKTKTLEKTFQLISDLEALEKQVAEIEDSKRSLSNEQLLLEKEVLTLQQETAQLKGKVLLDQLAQLDAQQDTLNNDLKQEMRHLQKAFLKMQALATSGGGAGITPDELKLLGVYMDNPFDAIVTEPQGCPSLREILEKLSRLLNEDKLKLKPDKQRKAEQAIQEILQRNSLANLHARSVDVAEQKKRLLASPDMEEAKRSMASFQQTVETLKARESNLKDDEKLKENQRQELLARIQNFKKSIEANVQSFMGKQIQLQ
jgi:hypothetical protein